MPRIAPSVPTVKISPNFGEPQEEGPFIDGGFNPPNPGFIRNGESNTNITIKPASLIDVFTRFDISLYGNNNTVDIKTGIKNDSVHVSGDANVGNINLAGGDDVFGFAAATISNNDLTIDGGAGNDLLALQNWSKKSEWFEGDPEPKNHNFTVDQIKSNLLADGSYELLMPDNNRLVLKNMEQVSYFDPTAEPPESGYEEPDPFGGQGPGMYVTLSLAEFIAKTQQQN